MVSCHHYSNVRIVTRSDLFLSFSILTICSSDTLASTDNIQDTAIHRQDLAIDIRVPR